jgi:hypothetical protein
MGQDIFVELLIADNKILKELESPGDYNKYWIISLNELTCTKI